MNILICGNTSWNDSDLDVLSEFGKDNIYFCPNEEAEIPIDACNVDVIICNWFFKYHKLSSFTNLKYIQLLSSGFNAVDPDEVRSRGITIYNARNVYSIPISEFVLGNILAFYKQNEFFWKNKHEHKWEKNRKLKELYEKNVLIVGVGSIGLEIAKRLIGFTDNIYGCNRSPLKNEMFAEIFPLEKLGDVISNMDIVILSIAMTKETAHLIDRDILHRMKQDSLVVNVSRGGVISERDLIQALEDGDIGGAVLDVFEEEPLSEDSPLWNMDNVIITPHNAFVSERNAARLKNVIMGNLTNWRNNNA